MVQHRIIGLHFQISLLSSTSNSLLIFVLAIELILTNHGEDK